jgi:UDP:flavonoid glycosyltransferase YjiC (YdhE family)
MRVTVIAGGDPGHVFPAAALTQALVNRGHVALLCTGESWIPALARDGIPAIAMPRPAPNPEPDGLRRLRQTSRRLAPQIAAALAAFGPDLVVADVMTPSGGLVAGLLDVPWIQLVPHPLQDPSRYLPPSSSGLAAARGPLGRLRDQRLYRITSEQWRQGDLARERDRERLGLPPDRGAPLGRLIASLAALEARRPDWPAATFQVGPLEWDPTRIELVPPPGDGPLLLLSGTTVAGATTGLAEATLIGLAGRGVRVAWTVLSPPEDGLPDWVTAGPGRQEPLISAAAAVICGGGHGILAKALTRGRPVITVPGGGEQRENADRVHRAGLGVKILPNRLTPRRLADAVQQVLTDPRFAHAAGSCRPRPGERGSGDRAVDVVERLMASAR